MSFADNLPVAPVEIYQRQTSSYRRTRSAILESARICLQIKGFAATSMIDIADTAEVSRATLYNHFRDKGSVFREWARADLERIFNGAKKAESNEKALSIIAAIVSEDLALAKLRSADPAFLTQIVSDQTNPAWDQVRAEMTQLFEDRDGLALTWLIGQVFQPLSSEQIKKDVEIIVGR